MENKAMIDRFGLQKTMARINSGKMSTRPDTITGLQDEWNIEYRITTDFVERSEQKADEHEVSNVAELDEEAMKERLEMVKEMQECMNVDGAGSSSSASGQPGVTPGATIKKEKADVETPPKDISKAADIMNAIECEVFKTLCKDPKKVNRDLNAKLTELKINFERTKNMKYGSELHADVTALLPKAVKIYKVSELIVVKHENKKEDAELGEKERAELLAASISIKKYIEEYNELNGNIKRFMPKKIKSDAS